MKPTEIPGEWSQGSDAIFLQTWVVELKNYQINWLNRSTHDRVLDVFFILHMNQTIQFLSIYIYISIISFVKLPHITFEFVFSPFFGCVFSQANGKKHPHGVRFVWLGHVTGISATWTPSAVKPFAGEWWFTVDFHRGGTEEPNIAKQAMTRTDGFQWQKTCGGAFIHVLHIIYIDI